MPVFPFVIGSSGGSLAQRVRRLLRSCEHYWDAETYVAGDQKLVNQGTVGSATDLQFGSTTGVDSADPTGLPYSGNPYFQLPGITGNGLTVPDSAALRVTGDVTITCLHTLDAVAAATPNLIGKRSGSSGEFLMRYAASAQFLNLVWWEGATAKVIASTAAVPVGLGAKVEVAVTRINDNGASGNDVRFFYRLLATDAWTQIGSTVTTAGVAAPTSTTNVVSLGDTPAAAQPLTGSLFGATIASGTGASGVPGGTTVLDVSAAGVPSSASSFVCSTGQTVTVNRATSGHKTSTVTTNMLRTGTDDYLEAPFHASFDPLLGNFTVLWGGRQWATPVTGGSFVAHRGASGTTGCWIMTNSTTTQAAIASVADGTTAVTATATATGTAGLPYVYGFQIDRAAQTIAMILNGVVGATTSIAALGSISSGAVLRVAMDAYAALLQNDATHRFVLVHRGLLSASNLAAINSYYQQVLA